ncbi:hypothetical protein C8R44DRAFT_991420 [Mycena epipterygia]|nr:hypothetical protein C8R44DRAFT_991420 [Mycena epipterygia]
MQATVSPCHECLFNIDLLEEILQHLVLVSLSTSRSDGGDALDLAIARESLLSVALTSTMFSQSAIHYLWRRLPNLIPLLKLLPTFELKPAAGAGDGHMIYELDPPAPQDWVLFDKRATSVKEIVCITYAIPLSASTYLHLSRHRTPLLPNLSCFQLGHKYLGNKFHGASEKQMRELVFPMLATNASHLTSMALTEQRISSLSDCPRQFIYLKHLELRYTSAGRTPTPADVYHGVGSLPHLQSLVLDFWYGNLNFAEGSMFPHLTHLHVPSGLFPRLLQFLQNLQSQSLESIILPREQYLNPYDASLVCRSISEVVARRWSATLRRFEFNAAFEDWAPLQSCTSLEVVHFVETHPFPIHSLLALGAGWTNLTSLSAASASGIDVVALTRIAQTWPRVRFLDVNLEETPLLPPLSATPRLSRPLRRLVLQGRPPLGDGDTYLLARHLHRLFPRLDSIRYGPEMFLGELNPWWVVLNDVFEFQARGKED